MRKYKQLKHAVQLQKQLDRKYGTSRFHAALIIALFFCLFFTSCSSSQAASSSSSTQTSTSTGQSQSGSTNVSIIKTGQTVSVNPVNPPNDGLKRIYSVYFAKKKVQKNQVSFDPIDSLHPQRDGEDNLLTYDSILGKTVYLVIETRNLTVNESINVQLQSKALTGNSEVLEVMQFNELRQYVSARNITAVVGNTNALHNNNGSCPYTNLADHSHRAIVKLQLRPSTRPAFDNWANRLKDANGTIKVSVQLEKDKCAYGNDNKERSKGGLFLSTDKQQFRVVNRHFLEIYHKDNLFNFLPIRTLPNTRKPIGELNNSVNSKVCYFYYDKNDNEHFVCESNKITIKSKIRSINIPKDEDKGNLIDTIDHSENINAGEIIHAQTLEIYENGTLGTPSRYAQDKIWYKNKKNNVELVFADILEDPGIGSEAFRALNYESPDGSFVITFAFQNTRRRYANPAFYAAFLGALAQLNQTKSMSNIYIKSGGFSYKDGSCYPSAEHVDGIAVDTIYLENLKQQNAFVNCLRNYGLLRHGVGKSNWYPKINHSIEMKGHDDHLHSSVYDAKYVNFTRDYVYSII